MQYMSGAASQRPLRPGVHTGITLLSPSWDLDKGLVQVAGTAFQNL